jgi:hypothetical protein
MTRYLVLIGKGGGPLTRFASHIADSDGRSICKAISQMWVWDGHEIDRGTWRLVDKPATVICHKCRQQVAILERPVKPVKKTQEQVAREREIELLLRLDPGYAERVVKE